MESANEGEGCAVKDETRRSLELAAKLLGVESANLETALVSKTMAVRLGEGSRVLVGLARREHGVVGGDRKETWRAERRRRTSRPSEVVAFRLTTFRR